MTMDRVFALKVKWRSYLSHLRKEDYVSEQFIELKRLHDKNNPNFMLEVYNFFLEDVGRLLNDISRALQEKVVDFKVVETYAHQFKACSSCIGAGRVNKVSIQLRDFCAAKNLEECFNCWRFLSQESLIFKEMLAEMFEIERQILSLGGSIPELL